MSDHRSCVILGRGRAGRSFGLALERAGWSTEVVSGHAVTSNALSVGDADLCLLSVPDDVVAAASAAVRGVGAVIAHVSGSLPLSVLEGHERVGSIHPLMSLPDPETGASRLADTCTFAVAGDSLLTEVVDTLGGRAIEVPDERRALYHAVAAIASNHVTALCAQIERLAAEVDVPVDAYWTLLRTTLDNVEQVGAANALTGPAARGDWHTIERHLDALPDPADRRLYLALCEQAATLADHTLPDDLYDVGR